MASTQSSEEKGLYLKEENAAEEGIVPLAALPCIYARLGYVHAPSHRLISKLPKARTLRIGFLKPLMSIIVSQNRKIIPCKLKWAALDSNSSTECAIGAEDSYILPSPPLQSPADSQTTRHRSSSILCQ